MFNYDMFELVASNVYMCVMYLWRQDVCLAFASSCTDGVNFLHRSIHLIGLTGCSGSVKFI